MSNTASIFAAMAVTAISLGVVAHTFSSGSVSSTQAHVRAPMMTSQTSVAAPLTAQMPGRSPTQAPGVTYTYQAAAQLPSEGSSTGFHDSRNLSSLPSMALASVVATMAIGAMYAMGRFARSTSSVGVFHEQTLPYGTADLAMVSVSGSPTDVVAKPAVKPPLQIFGEDESVFCYMTMEKRMPTIARDIVRDNPWLTEAQAAAVEEIAKELEDAGHGICRQVERLKADTTVPEKASDYERSLHEVFKPYVGKEWRETPWLHGEIFFYHRILEATEWFSHKKDYFEPPKMRSLELAKQSILILTNAVAGGSRPTAAEEPEVLRKLIHSCLWGNKVDLCLFKVDDFSQDGVQQKDKHSNIMTDDAPKVVDYLSSLKGKPSQVDFILDNCGYELFTDLVLTYFLLEFNWTDTVMLHCKEMPYYVSDAMAKDIVFMLDHLCGLGDESAKVIGERLQQFHAEGRLQWQSHPFWMAPSEFEDMPADVREMLGKSQLVVAKGDLNYRRLVGDRHWPYTTPFADAVGYFPTPVVALRTNKSEVLVGVDEASLAYVQSEDPEKWLVSGNFGVVSMWQP